ncbi:hypothetical protein V8G61_04500 [Gaetbulibacter sp. M240]|uniref:hypothetical protein n=1 Tax=Gaetbulibacter sp. M240 TaxID=3126511 RepID=UPI00374F5FAA
MKNYIKFLLFFILAFSISGCDLEPQDRFNFKPDVDLTDPFDNMTAWEYIQTRTKLNDNGSFHNQELNYLIAAIKRAGMEDEYNQTATTERTYLLLNNAAFLGGGDVIQIVTGSSTIPSGETPDETMARADVEKLRTVLRYHIVQSYIAQVPTLAESFVPYLFQTLIPGEDGLIAFARNDTWRIQINTAPVPLPSTATSQPEFVQRHNYVFKNGIGHYIADPVRNKPY